MLDSRKLHVLDGVIAAPPADQLAFLSKVQRILSEGQFTESCQFALLLSLADLAVEVCHQSGSSLTITTRRIAEKSITYLWRQVVPYMSNPAVPEGIVLHLSTGSETDVVNIVRAARLRHGRSLPALCQNTVAWRCLVSKVEDALWEQLLLPVGEQSLDFLYVHSLVGTRVNAVALQPAVAYTLRHFHPLVTELVRGSWLQFIRKTNAALLGSNADLMEFMFGVEPSDVSALCPALMDLQDGACFYCGKRVRSGGQVDRFVPRSSYPVDLGHNFVLADDHCKNAKGAMLAALPHRKRWQERNEEHGTLIEIQCVAANVRADLAASLQIAEWAYAQAANVGAEFWAGC